MSTQSLPAEMGARFRFWLAVRRSLPPGWLCSSQKRGTSSQILAQRHTQTNTLQSFWICDLCHKPKKKQETNLNQMYPHTLGSSEMHTYKNSDNTNLTGDAPFIHLHKILQQHQAQTTQLPITNQHPLTNNNQPKDKNIVILQININGIRNEIE